MMLPAAGLMAAVDLTGYISGLKLVPVLLIFLIWARVLSWIDKDAEGAHLPREILNTGIIIAGLAGVALFLFLPNYWIALGVLVVVDLASVGTYLGMRQRIVGLGDLKQQFREFLQGIFKREKKAKVSAGQVVLAMKSGTVLAAPESSDDPDVLGYQTSQLLLTDPLQKNAERIEVRPSEGGASFQYVVDGVAYKADTLDAGSASAAITYLKQAAALDTEDRRKPQSGFVRATLDGKRRDLEIATAGTTAGESLRISVDPKKRHELKFHTLGLLSEQLNAVQEILGGDPGITLIAAPRAQGLTTMLYSILRLHDAFLNHIQTIERGKREDLEGITQTALSAGATAAEEFKQVEWVCSQQPDTCMVDEVVNPASALELVRFADDGRRVYVGMRAGSTFEALTNWRRLVGDDVKASKSLRLIIAGRVMRRLCTACKLGYAPDPETLRKLNMDPAKVETLFQARTQPLQDNRGHPILCEFCQELRYKGRFGVYEVFVVNDDVRQVIAMGGSVNQLKTVFRKQHGLYLQEVALRQVEAGETSVQEVLRVLRNANEAQTPPPPVTPSKAKRIPPRPPKAPTA
ncbi:MAG: ATPase, T2SS/T4P/T4SS family [Planctomycetota bacterium]|nr:ATPase, T2SS/T4P/T4SS family [Planctomycetota bacterium]